MEEEYRAVRERAGIIDVSTLGKIEVKGSDAGRLLDLVSPTIFHPAHRPNTLLVSSAMSWEPLSMTAPSRAWTSSATLSPPPPGTSDYVHQWLEWWAAAAGWKVTVTNLTAGLASMNLAGPLARSVLQQLTDCDLSSAAFPYMDWRQAVGRPAFRPP